MFIVNLVQIKFLKVGEVMVQVKKLVVIKIKKIFLKYINLKKKIYIY